MDLFGDKLKSNEFQNEHESKEARKAGLEKRKKRLKEEEDNPGVIYESDDEWRQMRLYWQQATEEERENICYGMAFWQAAKAKDVAKFFAIKVDALKPYKEIFEQAVASLKLKIQGHQLRWAISTNQPNPKFFLGKQFAGQVENPAHEDMDSLDDPARAPEVNINVLNSEDVQKATEAFAGGMHTEQKLQ